MSRLWAITSYFNPAGYRRRLSNYRIFREHLNIPLATVELSFDGTFELEDSDADILLQLKAADVMWQKERLLNLLVYTLPEACDCVAWMDCDVIFGSKDWASCTVDALERYTLVQLFERRVDIPRDAPLEDIQGTSFAFLPEQDRPSLGFRLVQGSPVKNDFRRSSGQAQATTGLAWACRRALLESHGLYDACIIGGGDRMNLAAGMGWFDLALEFQKMSGPRKKHFLRWANGFYNLIEGRVGYVPGLVFHLWHGDYGDRQYISRFDILNWNSFDPATDISLDNQGVWKWNSEKPQLHRAIRDYFSTRFEDGRV